MRAPKDNLAAGIAGAVLGALVGAVAWAVLVTVTDYKIGFAAIGVGALAGFLAGKLGGAHPALPVVAAFAALVGCFVGDLMIDAHAVSNAVAEQGGKVSDFRVLKEMVKNPDDFGWPTYKDGFGAIDALFYVLAAAFGYRIAAQVGVQSGARPGVTPDPAMWAPVAEATPVTAPEEPADDEDPKHP